MIHKLRSRYLVEVSIFKFTFFPYFSCESNNTKVPKIFVLINIFGSKIELSTCVSAAKFIILLILYFFNNVITLFLFKILPFSNLIFFFFFISSLKKILLEL